MDNQDILLALDQGTTSCRAILFTGEGKIISSAQQPITQSYPHSGWVEHDPDEILRVQIAVAQDAVAQSDLQPEQIAGIGIANQRETLVVWERENGRPIYPAIVWQCRRTAGICARLAQREGLAEQIRLRTGLLIDAYFTATKLMWILDHVPHARARAERGELMAGTVDSWLIWHLSGRERHVTDPSNASRTMLYNIHTAQWDPYLLEQFDIPAGLLPEVVPSSGIAAHLDPAILPGNIPIAGLAGDQHAALFGQSCFEAGMTKNTYGTGCFILMFTGSKPVASEHHLLTTVAWDLGHGLEYALEGSVFNAGSAIQWLRDNLGIIERSSECDRLAEKVDDSGGVVFVPAFTGLGAPHWDMQARGILTGLTRGTGREQIARAVLEAIAHQSLDVLECMEKDSGKVIPVLKVDGGASVSDVMMQFQADICGLTVDRPLITETTAWGAVCLAGLAVGVWPDLAALAAIRSSDHLFQPRMSESERVSRRREWHNAVHSAIAHGRQE